MTLHGNVPQVNWPFWGTIQTLNYSLLHQDRRVLFVSIVNVFWSAFLSFMNQQARIATDD